MDYRINFHGIPQEDLEKTIPCIYGLSLLQSYNYGAAFPCIMDYLNSVFKKTHILVADTVTQYSYQALGYKAEESYEKSKYQSKKWLENPFVKKGINEKTDFIFWDTITSSERFSFYQNFVTEHYKSNDVFKEYVNYASSVSYANLILRKIKQINKKSLDIDHAIHYCKEYILEECAVVLMLTEDMAIDQKHYLTYPKKSETSKSSGEVVFKCFRMIIDGYKANKLNFGLFTLKKNGQPAEINQEKETSENVIAFNKPSLKPSPNAHTFITEEEFSKLLQSNLQITYLLAKNKNLSNSDYEKLCSVWENMKYFLPDIQDEQSYEKIILNNLRMKQAH